VILASLPPSEAISANGCSRASTVSASAESTATMTCATGGWPPRGGPRMTKLVTYRLTPRGSELMASLQPLVRWGLRWHGLQEQQRSAS
jgi:hypothetical protein